MNWARIVVFANWWPTALQALPAPLFLTRFGTPPAPAYAR